MFQSKNPRNSWLTIGYQLFGEDGPEGIQIERLARILQHNKSSFYHFFVNKDMFIDELVLIHRKIGDEMVGKIVKLESFDPGYVDLLLEYKDSVLFHRQLIRNGDNLCYKKTFDAINQKIDLAILPLWKREVNLSKESAFILFDMLRDTFYSRLNPKNKVPETIRSVINEAKIFIEQMKKDNAIPK